MSGFVDKAEVAALLHELAVEFRKAMPEEDRKRFEEAHAAGKSRIVSAQEVSEGVHELVVEFRKALKKAEATEKPKKDIGLL